MPAVSSFTKATLTDGFPKTIGLSVPPQILQMTMADLQIIYP